MIRTSLGPYQIVRRLGSGGMAEVFLATALGASGFERPVAVKTLVPGLQGEATLERALVGEARIAGRLAHRNLVAVLGLGVDDGVYYVVMEYVDGGDLDRLTRGRRLPPALALYVIEEAALALDYVHRARDERGLPLGLVHRDVSPSNLLVSREGEVKLGDFGVAKATALADLTGGTRKGKYGYMAPERLAGEPPAPAGDQFALGVVLVELASGVHPFEADTPLATMERVRAGRPDGVDGLPAAVAAVARRALAGVASARYETVGELRRELVRARREAGLELDDGGMVELGAWVRAGLAGES